VRIDRHVGLPLSKWRWQGLDRFSALIVYAEFTCGVFVGSDSYWTGPESDTYLVSNGGKSQENIGMNEPRRKRTDIVRKVAELIQNSPYAAERRGIRPMKE